MDVGIQRPKDGDVARNELRHDTTSSLRTDEQEDEVQEQQPQATQHPEQTHTVTDRQTYSHRHTTHRTHTMTNENLASFSSFGRM